MQPSTSSVSMGMSDSVSCWIKDAPRIQSKNSGMSAGVILSVSIRFRYHIFLTVCGSSEVEGMQKDLAALWEHFMPLQVLQTGFIAEAQQRFWGYSLGCNFVKQEAKMSLFCVDKIQWVI